MFAYSPSAPLHAPLLDKGWGDQLSLFGRRYWCLIGQLYALKSTILPCLMVTGFVLAFLPFHPLQAPLLDNGLGDPLSLFGHAYWYLLGSFHPFKLMIIT